MKEELYFCIKEMARRMEKKYEKVYVDNYSKYTYIKHIKPLYFNTGEVRGIAIIHNKMIGEVLLDVRASRMIVLIENSILFSNRIKGVIKLIRRYDKAIFGTCANGIEEGRILARFLSLLEREYLRLLPPAERVEWSPQIPSRIRLVGCRRCGEVHDIDFARRDGVVPYLEVLVKPWVTSYGGSATRH